MLRLWVPVVHVSHEAAVMPARAAITSQGLGKEGPAWMLIHMAAVTLRASVFTVHTIQIAHSSFHLGSQLPREQERSPRWSLENNCREHWVGHLRVAGGMGR